MNMISEKTKILIAGNTLEIVNEILSKIDKAKKYDSKQFVFSDNQINVDECGFDDVYDCIVLSIIGSTTRMNDIINKVKNILPTAEIILVSLTPSYKVTVEAFRSGVRDFLEYPLNKVDLNISIGRALAYKSFYHNEDYSKDILNVLNLFGDSRRFISEIDLYEKVNDFVKNKFDTNPFMVLKFKKNKLKNGLKNIEYDIFWSEEKNRLGCSKSDLEEVFAKVKMKDLFKNEKGVVSYKGTNNSFYIFYLKDDADYIFYGILKNSSAVASDKFDNVAPSFVKLVKNSTQNIIQFKARAELEYLAHKDDVTDLFNQRRLLHDVDLFIRKYQISKSPFSIIFMDIDHFKNVNDGHGHLIGSMLLVEIGKVLKKVLRDNDHIYRYGGDEFVILVPNADIKIVKNVANRVLKSIKKKIFNIDNNKEFKLSVSLGVATYPEDAKTKEEILDIADRMMYKAKNAGRGRVCLANEFFE